MENRHLYPENWKLLSWQCQGYSVEQGATRISKRGNRYKVRLAACHVDHAQRYQEDAELICLCERCHW